MFLLFIQFFCDTSKNKCNVCDKWNLLKLFDACALKKKTIAKQEKHFPTVTREINAYRYKGDGRDVVPHIIQKVCEAIEDAYGRLAPSVFDNDVYEKSRMACLQEIINDKHLSEKNGSTFLNVIDKNEINDWIAKSKYFC